MTSEQNPGPEDAAASAAMADPGADPAGGANPVSTPDSATEKPHEPEWWEDAKLPWGGKPTRKDIACFWAISLMGVYAFVMLPLRGIMLAHPYLAAGLTGSRTGMVMIGAMAAPPTSNHWWPLGLVIGILSIMKFDWIYFWAGRLWGYGIIEMIVGKSKRQRRNAERAEKVARKYATLGMLLTYLPIPFPAPVVYAVLGISGVSWRKFLTLDVIFATLLQCCYIYIGYRIGKPAVDLMEAYGRYAWYVTLAILAFMLIGWWWKSRREKADASA